MKYLIIGAGGVGGCFAAFMTEGGLDVAVVDQGEHLAAIKAGGLKMDTGFRGCYTVAPIKAYSVDEYNEVPDVIFVCVKEYSLESIIPFMKRVARPGTIVIPVINVFDIGLRLQTMMKELNVMDGCVYIAASITDPGCIKMHSKQLSIVYGVREPEMYTRFLDKIAFDLRFCGIEGAVSDNIKHDLLKKFSYVSPLAACTYYFDCKAGVLQKAGQERDMFIALVKEIDAMADALNIPISGDVVAMNLDILDNIQPDSNTTMMEDLKSGGPSEIDGLIFEVLRRSAAVGVEVPMYTMIAEKAGFRI